MLGRVRVAYQRVTLLVLLAVILPALGLVALGMDTVRRQRRAFEALRRANLRLAGERLTKEIEDLIAARVDRFLEIVRTQAPAKVDSGVFQAHMLVNLVNDGPVTLIVDKETS